MAGFTYADAGVSIDAQSALVERIKGMAMTTPRAGVLAGIGGFGGLFELPVAAYEQPILVSGSDGVGTKLALAHQLNQHDTIGIDLVAMCVNDILCHGAKPLYFLDYFATGRLQVDQAAAVIAGIAAGCRQAECSLLGGETAEMPGLYQGDDYDLAGFCVGLVDKPRLIQPDLVQAGDVLLALASSGPHANGYSLIRRIVSHAAVTLSEDIGGKSLGDVLLAPTSIYVKGVMALLASVDVHGLAHITGGGLTENVPRMLPAGLQARLLASSWEWPMIFHWLQANGRVSLAEMRRTFNLGVGMVVALPPHCVEVAQGLLAEQGLESWVVGDVVAAKGEGVEWQNA